MSAKIVGHIGILVKKIVWQKEICYETYKNKVDISFEA